MSRRALIAACLAAALAGSEAAAGRDDDPRPNILLIYADDLDFDEVGHYATTHFPSRTGAVELGFPSKAFGDYAGVPGLLMPHIDSLAADGVILDRFYVTTPVCVPSRYTTLTGRFVSRNPSLIDNYPPDTQIRIRGAPALGPDETNIAKVLKAAGYATGMVGKWHLGSPWRHAEGVAEDSDPSAADVQAQIGTWYAANRDYIRSNFGFDFVESIYVGNKESMGLPRPLRVHNLEWLTAGALQFIEESRERPFFLYMPLTTPHGNYGTAFLLTDPRVTPGGILETAPGVQPPRADIVKRLHEAGIHRTKAMATWIDDAVGAVLNRLDALGLAENTVVVFTSDHQSRGKFTCYEGAHVPCFIRWPKRIAGGRRVGALAANVDLAATFAELAGAELPGDMTTDGRSFLPFLVGEEPPAPWRQSLHLEIAHIRAVVTPKWKYIANRLPPEEQARMDADAADAARTGKKRTIGWSGATAPAPPVVEFPAYFAPDQLYDLENDPYEQNNLAGDAAHARRLQHLKGLLRRNLENLPHTFGEFKTAPGSG